MDYAKLPKYITHIDDTSADAPIVDENENPSMMIANADGFEIGGVQYYNKTKVDALLSAKEASIKSWAESTFQTKGGA